MFYQVSERWTNRFRWSLFSAWVILIASLFFDPISKILTDPHSTWSPLHLDPSLCVSVQGRCFVLEPYIVGPAIFWGIVLPVAILSYVTFGHEFWRRICPLSFLSQLPKAVGVQRRFKSFDRITEKIRYETPKIKPDSWLGRNHTYLQFGLLFGGLCGRILFFNATCLVLAGLFLATMLAAVTFGYLYAGKSWCHYICPMAPVQRIYMQPTALFSSPAYLSGSSPSQSMCRVIVPGEKDQSACVGCSKACMDIDAARSYWSTIQDPEQSFLHYSYVGLVIGYFAYYYLYSGTLDYYLSGVWAQDARQLEALFKPGFYLFHHAIGIPKLVAAPLTLGGASILSYLMGRFLEQKLIQRLLQRGVQPSLELVRHRLFCLVKFIVFHVYFAFGGRPFLQLLPDGLQYSYQLGIILLSLLWMQRLWNRSPLAYKQEIKLHKAQKSLCVGTKH